MRNFLLMALLGCSSVTGVHAQSTPTIVADISTGLGNSSPMALTAFTNGLYFVAQPGTQSTQGNWKYDGTSAAAAITVTGGQCVQTRPMAVANGKLFLACSSTSTPDQLWYYTGTGNAVAVPNTLVDGNSPMVTLNNKVYFKGGIGSSTGLYYCDATTNTATYTNVGISGLIFEMVAYNNKIYYVTAPMDMELYVYDPATNLSTLIPSSCPSCSGNFWSGSEPKSLHVGDNNKLYYSAKSSGEGREMFVIDGSTAPVKITALYSTNDGVAGAGPSFPANITKFGNAVYFSGHDGVSGYELMKLDLSNNTTSLVKDINTGTNSSYPSIITLFAGKMYFSATTAANGAELWSSDGTATGTVMLADLNPGTPDGVDATNSNFTIYNNKLYFGAKNATSGLELFRVGDPTGIQSVTLTENIKVYPVPAQNEVVFDISLLNATVLSISLKDISGKNVYTGELKYFNAGPATVKVPVLQLSPGVYSYTISSDKGALIGSGRITHQ